MNIQSDWFQHSVLNWANQHGRHNFPWQAPHSPYKTWISEIMLQQTQAQRVVGFFTAFIDQFPDVNSLAGAQEDEVFHLWSGLGYYTRAQNLLKAARQIFHQHDGKIPTSLDDLIALPGIGRSTAGAIRSLGHGLEGEILDGNVRRVLGRFRMIQGKPQSQSMEASYWQLVSLMTPSKPLEDRAFNQAMMDLGATVCTIKNPKCSECPINSQCRAYQENAIEQYPITMAKYKKTQAISQEKRKERRYYLFAQHNNTILLEKRPAHGIWRNLWCPIEFKSLDALTDFASKQFGKETLFTALEPIHHQFTHFHLELRAYVGQLFSQKKAMANLEVRESERYLWYNVDAPPNLGLASPIAKLIMALKAAHSYEPTCIPEV